MRIAMIKKVMANGQDCFRCQEVEKKLRQDGYMDRIDRVLIADERDIGSAGWLAAMRYGVEQAPFFVISYDDGHDEVITQYVELLKFVECRDNAVNISD